MTIGSSAKPMATSVGRRWAHIRAFAASYDDIEVCQFW